MKKMLICFPLVLLVLCFSACNESKAAEPCPVEVMLTTRNDRPNTLIRITAVVDGVAITGVEVNRGNTEALIDPDKLNKELKFSNAVFFTAMTRYDRIKEVTVQTNKGAWTFSFN